MRHVLVKIYGALHPAEDSWATELAFTGRDAVGQDEPWFSIESGVLRISFEGMYFPLDNVLSVLETLCAPAIEGKIDCLDLEAWTLTRYLPAPSGENKGCRFSSSTRGLNQVLEYSGH